jgi:hypothetical protein
MDVTPIEVVAAQYLSRGYHLFHGAIRTPMYGGAQKQPLHHLSTVQLVEKVSQFFGFETRPWEVAILAVETVETVVIAGVGEEDLEEFHRLAVGQGSGIDPTAHLVLHPMALSTSAA